MKSLKDIENFNESLQAVSILAENCIDTHTISKMLNLNLDIETVNALYDEHLACKKPLPNVKSSVQPPTMPESYNSITSKHLSQLTTTALYTLGLLCGKNEWEVAGPLAKTMKSQGVECDYFDFIIERYDRAIKIKEHDRDNS